MSILLNCNWKKKHYRRKKTKWELLKEIIKREERDIILWLKSWTSIQEMESKSRNIPYRKSEVGELQMIKEC